MKRYGITIVNILIGIAAVCLIYYHYFSPLIKVKDEVPEQFTTSSLVEKALAFPLPETDTVSRAESLEIVGRAFEKVEKTDYEEALAITFAGLEKYPSDFIIQSELATLLGDHATNYRSPLKQRMIARSKEIFERLFNEAERQPKRFQHWFKNEYYYRFGNYKEQYELGLRRVAEDWGTDRWGKGYYSQGVGASNYARELLKQDKKELALEYAQKALVAWAQYFTYDNTYYNAYVHYALALGILGFKQEMMRALERSASIIGCDLDYVEFKEITQFIQEIEENKAS